MGSTALVIGSTGLVGGHLIRELAADPRFDRIVSFARRRPSFEHPKLDAQVVDFRAPVSWADRVRGDVLFSALGTTRKQAGSNDAQYEVDYTFQFNAAKAAAANGVRTLALVSSSGADPGSRIFYSRIKGELERDVCALGFPRVRILRPGILDGDREQRRPAEHAAATVMQALRFVPGLKALRPIHGRFVARALIQAWSEDDQAIAVYGMGDVFALAERADAPAAAARVAAQ